MPCQCIPKHSSLEIDELGNGRSTLASESDFSGHPDPVPRAGQHAHQGTHHMTIPQNYTNTKVIQCLISTTEAASLLAIDYHSLEPCCITNQDHNLN